MKIKVGDDTYDYDPNALTLREARELKKQAGLEFTDFASINLRDPQILTAYIWLCRVRDGEKQLKFDDVDVPIAQLAVDLEIPGEETPTPATQPEDSAGSPTKSSE